MGEKNLEESGTDFERRMADPILRMFFSNVCLQLKLKPLEEFVEDRDSVINLDTLELPELETCNEQERVC